MRRVSAICLVLFALGRIAAGAEWRIVSASDESSAVAGVEHWHVVAEKAADGQRATLELASFSSKSATLRVIDNPTGADNLAAAMQREGCIAGVNGGYFDPDFAPVGLLISEGRVIAPLRKARLLSGVVSAVNGRVIVRRPSEFSMKKKPAAARQCGPFLIDRGQAIAGLNDTRSARRTFVATSGERALIGDCSDVTLAQLAKILTMPEWKIQRAMNFDGGSSSAFWFKRNDGSALSIGEYKSVRDFVGVVPR